MIATRASSVVMHCWASARFEAATSSIVAVRTKDVRSGTPKAMMDVSCISQNMEGALGKIPIEPKRGPGIGRIGNLSVGITSFFKGVSQIRGIDFVRECPSMIVITVSTDFNNADMHLGPPVSRCIMHGH